MITVRRAERIAVFAENRSGAKTLDCIIGSILERGKHRRNAWPAAARNGGVSAMPPPAMQGLGSSVSAGNAMPDMAATLARMVSMCRALNP